MENATHADVEWQTDYATGVELIDWQHRWLLDMIDELALLASRPAGHSEFIRRLDEFEAYARMHFAAEERLARALPESGENRLLLLRECDEHEEYRQRIAAFRDAAHGGAATDSARFVAFANQWWLGHILGSDALLGRLLNASGIH